MYGVSHDDDEPGDDEQKKKHRRATAPKEKVLHTRVPAVLEEELKRLATNLRVPVSNVVRAILEDAVDAVDTVGEVAEGELLGFVHRVSRQRDNLRGRVTRAREKRTDEVPPDDEELCCPAASDALDGAFGFQTLVLAAPAQCAVCDRALPAGSKVSRALFDDPQKRLFLGSKCRLLPKKG